MYPADPAPIGPLNDQTILAINTKPFNARTLTFDLNGNVDYDVNWDYRDGTDAFFGCSVNYGIPNYGGQMRYYGGVGLNTNQAARVDKDNCGLTRLPNLPFNFPSGTCKTYTIEIDGNEKEYLFLCFSDIESTYCRIFDGVSYMDNKIANTTYQHSFTELASFEGKPFITGDYQGPYTNNAKTEIYNLNDDSTWYQAADYPYGDFISFYSTVSTDQSAFIIGGRQEAQLGQIVDQYTAVLAQYTRDSAGQMQWYEFSTLLQQRVGHNSILVEDQLVIFGGSARDLAGNPEAAKTEIWNITDASIAPKQIAPFLKSRDYQFGIGLYMVEKDFCKKT